MKFMRQLFVLVLLLFATLGANASPDSNQIIPEPLGLEESLSLQQASMQATDYGLVGAMALGILALFGYVIKAERSDRNRLIEAINQLSQSNNNFANEVRNGFNSMERRIDALEDAVRRNE